MEVIFATHNRGKFREAEEKFRDAGIVLKQYNLEYVEIQADDVLDVALYSSRYLSRRIDKPYFLEDAGLFIDALGGFPGVYSSYVFKKLGCKGILKLMKGIDDRGAKFKSIVVYRERGRRAKVFIGECKGRISYKERGNGGFGFDPIFIPEGSNKTFGEMSTEEKNLYSHRSKSLEMLLNYLKANHRENH